MAVGINGSWNAVDEAVVATVGDAIGGNVTTKADLAEVRAALKADIAAVKAEIAELEARLYRHLWAMAAGIVGLTVSLNVALVKLTS